MEPSYPIVTPYLSGVIPLDNTKDGHPAYAGGKGQMTINADPWEHQQDNTVENASLDEIVADHSLSSPSRRKKTSKQEQITR